MLPCHTAPPASITCRYRCRYVLRHLHQWHTIPSAGHSRGANFLTQDQPKPKKLENTEKSQFWPCSDVYNALAEQACIRQALSGLGKTQTAFKEGRWQFKTRISLFHRLHRLADNVMVPEQVVDIVHIF